MWRPGGASDGIVHGGNRHFEQRPFGRPAVLGVIPGPLDVLDRRADVHGGAMLRPGARQCAEIRQSRKRQIHFERRAFDAETANGLAEFGIEIAFLHQSQKRHVRIEVRRDDGRLDFLAALEHDAAHASAARRECAGPERSRGSRRRGCGPIARWLRRSRPCRRARIPTGRACRRRRPCSDAAGCTRCRASAVRRWRRSRRRSRA